MLRAILISILTKVKIGVNISCSRNGGCTALISTKKQPQNYFNTLLVIGRSIHNSLTSWQYQSLIRV